MKRLRIAGMPVHPMLVHLPIGAWVLVPAVDLAYLLTDDLFWWKLGFRLLILGTLGALPAMAAGFLDAITLENDHPAARAVNRHMMFMAGAWTSFGVALIPHRGDSGTGGEVITALLLSGLGLLLMVIGGHIGATLVYRFGVGREASPQQSRQQSRTKQ